MKEQKHKRSINQKCFRDDKGRGRIKASVRPQHYRDEAGKLQEVSLVPRLDRGTYLIEHNAHKVRVARNAPMYWYTGAAGSVSVELTHIGDQDQRKYTQWGDLRGNEHVWPGIGINCDYSIVPGAAGIATFLTLHSAKSERSWQWEVLGNKAMIQPITGLDAAGQRCEINTRWVGDSLIAEWTGRVTSVRRSRRGRVIWNHDVQYPVKIDPSVSEVISATGDDRDQIGADLYTGYTSIQAGYNYGQLIVAGFRFQTLAVPNAATIDSATFSIEVIGNEGTADLRIHGVDIDDVNTWSDPGNLPASAPQTTAFTEIDDFTSTGIKTVDVTAIVQEIVNRGGWLSGNDIGFVIIDQSGANNNNANLADLSHATAQSAELDVTYDEAGGAPALVGSGLVEGVLLNPRALVS